MARLTRFQHNDGRLAATAVIEGGFVSEVRHLTAELRDRDLDVSEGVLFVLEGARCRVHKESSVIGPPA